MKFKSETRSILQSFVKLISVQYSKSVKIIRSDNGKEFMMNDFYANLGIIHQTFGVVERKHQNILATTRSLMFQSNLPLYFWNYAISHSVFLLN